ncbi:MAG: ATP-dependent DNA helicase RecG, partial [Acidimicrobiia bacterium]
VDESYGIAMSGWEDVDIQDYFINTAFPSEHDCNLILTHLRSAGDGLRLREIEEIVNLRKSRITAMLKILEVEGAVYRDGSRWRRSAQPWTYPAERVTAVTAERRAEQAAMQQYISTDACLMEFLRRQLDDAGAERCGRCANCVGAMFSTDVDGALVEEALGHLRKTLLEITPRKALPCDLGIDINLRDNRIEVGRSLTRWGDPGLARLVEHGKYRDGHFDDRIVEAAAGLFAEWAPLPSPEWLTWIPSISSTALIEDFAHRLAAKVGIEAVETLERVRTSQPQKTMQNSCQQARNIAGAFDIVDSRPGPVLLVDDVVDSRWTFTILGSQLRSATGHPVYPLALADTSGRGT